MYPHELLQYIESRGHWLNKGEMWFVTDIRQHPQINSIKYNPWDNKFEMWDRYGNYYWFYSIEAEELRRKRER